MKSAPDSDPNLYAAPAAPVTPQVEAVHGPRSRKGVARDLLQAMSMFLILGTPLGVGTSLLIGVAEPMISRGQLSLSPLPDPQTLLMAALGAVVLHLPATVVTATAAGLLRPRLRARWRWHVGLLLLATMLALAWVYLLSVAVGERDVPMVLALPALLPIPLLLWLFARPQRVRQAVDPV